MRIHWKYEMRYPILLLSLILLSPVAWAQESSSQQGEGNNNPSQPEKVESTKVEVDAAQLQLIVNVEVAARAAGIIDEVMVVEGSRVVKGDSLVRLDKEEARAYVESARTDFGVSLEESKNDVDLKYARVSKEVSGKVYQRSVKANQQFAKAVSKTELERLKLEYERATLSGEQAERTAVINELKVEQKRAQLDIARVQLRNHEIAAPASGVVVEVYQQVGEWVQPGQPLARVVDMSKLRVTCRCYLAKASPEEISEEATFVYGGKEFRAKVVFASPEIDPDLQDFEVLAEIDNTDRKLKPGMSGAMILNRMGE